MRTYVSQVVSNEQEREGVEEELAVAHAGGEVLRLEQLVVVDAESDVA
mgnify:CR=1 FL=1